MDVERNENLPGSPVLCPPLPTNTLNFACSEIRDEHQPPNYLWISSDHARVQGSNDERGKYWIRDVYCIGWEEKKKKITREERDE